MLVEPVQLDGPTVGGGREKKNPKKLSESKKGKRSLEADWKDFLSQRARSREKRSPTQQMPPCNLI